MRLHFCMVQFDLFNTPRGFAIFYLLVVYCQPRARGRRNFPTPELLTDLIHVRFLGVHLFEKNNDFRAIAK